MTPYLFKFTPQDERAAARPKSSEPFLAGELESALRLIIRLPTNKTDGVDQPSDQMDTTVNQTTVFHDDGPVVVKEFPKYVSIGEQFRDASLDSRAHSLKDFLGRPILCASGTWSVTNGVGTQLQTINLPAACMSNSTYAEKVRGFYGFRAKMVCRVQVNSQRFQQGRLLLHYLPQASAMNPARRVCSLSSLVLLTQQPRVDFNLNEDTEVRLEIPYVSTSMYYNMQNGEFDFGTFYLTVYSPLKTGAGATTCSYSVWCHFEDVEVSFPATSQSGIKIGRGRGGKSAGRVDVTDQELQEAGVGSISGFLSRASKASSIVGEIPMISSFAAPTSWMLSVLSRAADSLGYSKPASAEHAQKATLSTFANMNNTNIVDNSTKMAIRADNQIAQLPGFAGTDIDEMMISHIISIPTYQWNFSWTTGSGVGASLVQQSIGPMVFNNLATITALSVNYPIKYPSPTTYFANIFQYYRGSMTLTLKVVKTEFHSGRIQVAFFPGRNISGSACTMAASQMVFREIIDLRESSEVTITFPFSALTPYMNCVDHYGMCDIRVINPLVAPENLSTSVDVIMEWNAAPDFEFAVPIPAREVPIIFTSQSGIIFHAQAGSATSHGEGNVMGSSAITTAMEPSHYCIGERVQSIRQLIKRFTTSFVASAVNDPVMAIEPQLNYVSALSSVSGPQVHADLRTDMVSYFAPLFRYCRGAMRHKVIDPANQGSSLVAQVRVATAAGGPPIFFGAVQPKGCCDQPVVALPNLSGGIEVESPFYNSTHVAGVRTYATATVESIRPHTDCPLLLQVTQGASYSTATRVYRAAGDDYSLGFFIGTIPLTGHATFNKAA